MKKVLFIDRDGTLVIEPPIDLQLDSLEKLEIYPKVLRNLYRIRQETSYELVIVTNQDGLGTTSFPEEDFILPHEKMLLIFKNEGITFDNILIDRSFAHENAPTRKPRTGLLEAYLNNPEYDLKNSFVIGDRLTDVELAKNLGAKAILMQTELPESSNAKELEQYIDFMSMDWDLITNHLLSENSRKAFISRKTKETEIEISLDLDGEGRHEINTGIGFFDHMLVQLAYHSKSDLRISVKGDLHIDEHHTIEDTALALGEAFAKALGQKRGIERYGFYNLVMDESLAKVALDFSGRPYLVWKNSFQREKVGGMPTEMFEHFFKSFSDASKCNIFIECEGKNEHHQIEAIFKAFAKSIKVAVKITNSEIQSTKGIL